MRHTLWHCGVLIGDAKMRKYPGQPRHIFGEFRPTAYGREVLPRVTGSLTACADLKDEMAARGLTEEALVNESSGPDVLESTRGGKKMLELGRALSDLELRDPDGRVLQWKTLAFLDLAELGALSRRVGGRAALSVDQVNAEGPSRVIVSATLAPPQPFARSEAARSSS